MQTPAVLISPRQLCNVMHTDGNANMQFPDNDSDSNLMEYNFRLDEILAKGTLYPLFQPIIDLNQGVVCLSLIHI